MHIHRPDPPQAAELQRWQDALRVCTSWHWIQKRNFAALRYVNFVRVYLRKHRRVRFFLSQMCEVSLHLNTFATLLVLIAHLHAGLLRVREFPMAEIEHFVST